APPVPGGPTAAEVRLPRAEGPAAGEHDQPRRPGRTRASDREAHGEAAGRPAAGRGGNPRVPPAPGRGAAGPACRPARAALRPRGARRGRYPDARPEPVGRYPVAGRGGEDAGAGADSRSEEAERPPTPAGAGAGPRRQAGRTRGGRGPAAVGAAHGRGHRGAAGADPAGRPVRHAPPAVLSGFDPAAARCYHALSGSAPSFPASVVMHGTHGPVHAEADLLQAIPDGTGSPAPTAAADPPARVLVVAVARLTAGHPRRGEAPLLPARPRLGRVPDPGPPGP